VLRNAHAQLAFSVIFSAIASTWKYDFTGVAGVPLTMSAGVVSSSWMVAPVATVKFGMVSTADTRLVLSTAMTVALASASEAKTS
jgi:hypothetical protein